MKIKVTKELSPSFLIINYSLLISRVFTKFSSGIYDLENFF